MYKLYYSPGAFSLAIHVVLNEIKAEFELENVAISERKNRGEEFLKINPRGQVPVLIDGDNIIREGAAILIHLLEKHDSNLLPKLGNERLAALQWLMFCNASLHTAYSRVFFLMKNLEEKAENKEKLFSTAVAMINKLWDEVEERLTQQSYLAGNYMTIADILLTVIANWSPRMPGEIKLGNKTKELLKKISSLPSYQKSLTTEGVEYKVVN